MASLVEIREVEDAAGHRLSGEAQPLEEMVGTAADALRDLTLRLSAAIKQKRPAGEATEDDAAAPAPPAAAARASQGPPLGAAAPPSTAEDEAAAKAAILAAQDAAPPAPPKLSYEQVMARLDELQALEEATGPERHAISAKSSWGRGFFNNAPSKKQAPAATAAPRQRPAATPEAPSSQDLPTSAAAAALLARRAAASASTSPAAAEAPRRAASDLESSGSTTAVRGKAAALKPAAANRASAKNVTFAAEQPKDESPWKRGFLDQTPSAAAAPPSAATAAAAQPVKAAPLPVKKPINSVVGVVRERTVRKSSGIGPRVTDEQPIFVSKFREERNQYIQNAQDQAVAAASSAPFNFGTDSPQNENY